jgi:glycerol-3-phosphate acyltransferase PlsY
LKALFIVLLGYLIGSIPFGYLIVKARAGADIRRTGSGGTGATNVSRSAGKAAGLLTLVLDAAKGGFAVLLARTFIASDRSLTWVIALAALAVLLGHIFPLWLGFRGGKGVATALGVFLVLNPIAVVAAAALFLMTVFFTRYVSLASIVATLLIPVLIFLQIGTDGSPVNQRLLFLTSIVVSALIVLAHRSNIDRLLQGKERKFR